MEAVEEDERVVLAMMLLQVRLEARAPRPLLLQPLRFIVGRVIVSVDPVGVLPRTTPGRAYGRWRSGGR